MNTPLKCDCLNDCGDDPRIKKGLVAPCKRYVEAEKIACYSCGLTVEQSHHLANRANTPDSAAQGAMIDPNIERNVDLLRIRSAVGIKKYGVTTDKSGLTRDQWKRHLLEELLDAANYIQAELNTPDAQPSDATAQPIMGVLESFVNEVALGAYTQDELRPKALQALHRYKAAQPKVDLTDERAALAHELWATAQLLPNEGIEDGVARIVDLLANTAQGKPDHLRGVTKMVPEHVAEICRDWQIFYAGSESIKAIADRHNLKIGTKLYTLDALAAKKG